MPKLLEKGLRLNDLHSMVISKINEYSGEGQIQLTGAGSHIVEKEPIPIALRAKYLLLPRK